MRQLYPNEVFASAPGGSDSMTSVSVCGADFKSRFRLGIVEEHAASMKPHATTAISRLMIPTTWAATPQNTVKGGAGDPAQLRPLPAHAMATALECL